MNGTSAITRRKSPQSSHRGRHARNEQAQLHVQSRFELSELLSQCDLTVPPLEDLASWDAIKPVGEELW